MKRPVLPAAAFALFLCLGPTNAQAQDTPPAVRLGARPPVDLPRNRAPHLRRSFDERSDLYTTDLGAWFAHVDSLRARVATTLLDGEPDAAEEVLSEAMSELALLHRQPDARSDGRFARVYADLVSTYEAFYGEALPEDAFLDELFAVRDELTDLLVELDDPLDATELPEEIAPLASTVPMTVNRTVTSTMEWLRNRPKTLSGWLARAHTYFPMIEKIFAEEGVPDELKYLAMIESGLRPAVRSRARAVGMWQFVAATGATYGLRADRWVDERKDPEKATRAAARHLKDLYSQYGDWHVALAGYNCSPRCIRRAISGAKARGAEQPTYWDMYPFLPRETRGYVPQFIATALMLSNPSAYELSTDEMAPVYEYELVPVRGSLPLERVAQMAGTELATVQFLNPALHGGYVPRAKDPYPLRLPVGTSAAFLDQYAALPAEALVPPGEYRVRKGDTLSEIASRYGITVSELKRTNGLGGNLIRIGQVLTVPVAEYGSPLPGESIAEAEPVLVQYGALAYRPVAPSQPFDGDTVARGDARPSIPVVTASVGEGRDGETTTTVPDPEAATVVSYRIRRGDTLIDIARKYDVSVDDLRSWNGLSGSSIRAGATLKLYLAGAGTPASTSEPVTYRVRSGDTLSDIAAAHGVTVDDLRGWNQLRGSTIRPGQRLTIYPAGTGTLARSHRVVSGDNLYDIARRYGVTVDELKAWNRLTSSRIDPGDELRILK